jgi:predicted DNA-binding transcriptional regulator YafY
VLEPYGVVLKAGRWYLVARGSGPLATYRVSQILSLESLDERFTRPADFDLAVYWQTYLDDFEARRHRGSAVVRLSPGGVERLPDTMPAAVVTAVASTATPVGVDGWVEAVIPIESVGHAVTDLLRMGTDVEVVGPAGLRDRMIDTIRLLAGRYLPGS